MFPGADSNRFTVPYSDQYSLYSKLLDDDDDDDDGDVDIDSNIHNPDSSFSFFDQNITHPNFLDHEQFELKNTFMEQHHEAQPIVTAFEEFTMADASSNSTSMGAYGFAGGHSVTGISTGAVGDVKDDKVRKNGVWSKKDRHSKINTAQGLRDRRMRLSLDVARRFFGLQDMLGFDKASKTVDWLLSKSQSEISEVAHSKNIATARSDIEEASEVVNKDDVSQSGGMDSGKLNKMSGSMKKKKKKKTGKMSFRNRFSNLLDKESREKARARARERTKEKKMICRSQNHNKLDDNVEHFSNMDQSLLTQVKKPEFLNLGPHAYSYVDQRDTMADESLGNTSYWNPTSTIFSHLHQQSSEASQQVQFGEIQFYARPWESYN